LAAVDAAKPRIVAHDRKSFRHSARKSNSTRRALWQFDSATMATVGFRAMDEQSVGDPFTQSMGVEYLIDDGGLRRLALTLGATHMSRANRVHGGVLFTLLDTALGGAVVSALPPGKGCATLE